MTTDTRYPIGKFSRPTHVSLEDRRALVRRVHALPALLRSAVNGLSEEQLNTPYRDGGWTVRQVVHHIGDSHVNCLIRFKLGLTEERPTIRPYEENDWVRTEDSQALSMNDLLQFVDVLHTRLHAIVSPLDEQTGARTIVHPESGEQTLDQLLALYAWHGDHHVAHITSLRATNGW